MYEECFHISSDVPDIWVLILTYILCQEWNEENEL